MRAVYMNCGGWLPLLDREQFAASNPAASCFPPQCVRIIKSNEDFTTDCAARPAATEGIEPRISRIKKIFQRKVAKAQRRKEGIPIPNRDGVQGAGGPPDSESRSLPANSQSVKSLKSVVHFAWFQPRPAKAASPANSRQNYA